MDENQQPTSAEASGRPGYSPYGLGAGVGVLIALASVLLFVSFIALWTDRQIFNSDQWTKTSTEVIERPAVQNALATYLVDQLFESVDVEREIKQQLPGDWQVLASPATSALRSITLSGAKKVLELPVTQEAWSGANRIAHQALIDILSGREGNVSVQEGTVTINARSILEQAANKLGLSGNLVNKIPADAGSFEIWHSNNLKTAQNAYRVFEGLSWIFAALTIMLYVLAIALARGRRRRAVIWMGASFVVVGLLVMIAVSLARTPVVDSLAQTTSVVPAVTDVYDIATELLSKMAGSLLFTGILVLLATLLTGPYNWAIRTREFLAPYLRDQLPIAAGAAVLLFLIVLWLVPVSGFRTTVGLTINTALAIAGFIALVSITRREFPDAQPVDFGALGEWASLRWREGRDLATDLARRGARTARIGGGEERTVKTERDVSKEDAVTESSTSAAASIDELERLQKLLKDGALTEEEFTAAKRRLLDS